MPVARSKFPSSPSMRAQFCTDALKEAEKGLGFKTGREKSNYEDEMPLKIGEVAEAKQQPEIIVSSKALQVAKGWVRNMLGESESDSEGEDSKTVDLEARPPRLGLGAKYLPHSQVAATMGPVERKLRAMTGAGKQQGRGREFMGKHKFAVSTTPAKESKSDTESDDEEEEVKGSSRIQHGRQQRRIGSDDLLTKTSGSKGRGNKRKR